MARGRDRSQADAPTGPELVFAIVKPVGTPDEDFHKALAGGLLDYGYSAERIKLSDILSDVATDRAAPISTTPVDERIAGLMDLGDQICSEVANPSAIALLGVNEIRLRRAEHHAKLEGLSEDDRQGTPIPRRAWIVDSIKRVAEVKALRAVYGDRVLVIGLKATEKERLKHLKAQIKPGHTGCTDEQAKHLAQALIDRDLTEKEALGQNMLRTFPMCDVFIDGAGAADAQVSRVLDLLFGNPEYSPPTPAEYGMQLAYVSSTRSPELGLKVGAAILRSDYSIVGLGVNRHPVSRESPAFDSSLLDIRAVVQDTLQRLGSDWLRDEVAERLKQEPEVLVTELLSGPLDEAQLKGLTEFQPPVHAEMDALLDALKNRADVSDCAIYVTAYPCHNCAKHLIALGIDVHYLEPYPKSRAEAMYGDAVKEFSSFTGIAPRRYERLFQVPEDRKNTDGSRKPWSAKEKKLAKPRIDPFVVPDGIADRESSGIALLPEELLNGGTVGPLEQHVERKSEPPAVEVSPEGASKPATRTRHTEPQTAHNTKGTKA